MERINSYSIGQKIFNVWLGEIQDLGVAHRASTVGDLSAMGDGIEARLWQATADLNTAAMILVDDEVISIVNTGTDPATLTTSTLSWYDREVFGVYRGYAGASQNPGQANDYQFDAQAPVLFWGYFGKGALGAASAPVANGTPPVPASTTSWAVQVTTNLWLFVQPSDGKLYLYNNTGSTIRTPSLWFFATAPTGKRPI
jgi:hypothetical protein